MPSTSGRLAPMTSAAVARGVFRRRPACARAAPRSVWVRLSIGYRLDPAGSRCIVEGLPPDPRAPMLETLDLDKKVEKDAYEKAFPELRDQLRELQRQAFEAKIPVCVLFEGWDAAGKGDAIQKLGERLDPRGVKVHPISAPLEEEKLRPFLWRFWTKIPGRGEMAIFDRSWYGRVMVDRVDHLISPKEWQSAYNEIVQFERMLTDDGTVMVKFWLQISE